MLYHGAWLANEGLPCSVETSMAKLFVADVGVEIALACQQIMGAYALSDAYDIERNVRDLLGMPIVGGSSDMQKNKLLLSVGTAKLKFYWEPAENYEITAAMRNGIRVSREEQSRNEQLF